MTVAVIADIVGSRALADRSGAQRRIEVALAAVGRDVPGAVLPLHATVGDEFQGVYADLGTALRATLLVQLDLPDGIGLRFGLGVGGIRPVDSSSTELSDGPGWWSARAAIEAVHALQRRAVPTARTGIVGGEGQDDAVTQAIALATAYVLARDELVAGMAERVRRLVRGRCLGVSQHDLAAVEGISQSAVSQSLAAAGASALVAGFTGLAEAP